MSLYINDDAWCFFANRTQQSSIVETMDEAGLKRQIDYYAASGVTAILFNPNAMRAFFDSRVFEPLWEGMEEGADGKARYKGREICTAMNGEDQVMLCRNTKALFQNVADPYRVRYDYCKKKNVEMWISMRMNDVHHVNNPEEIVHGKLWYENPQFRRAYYKKDHTFWFSQCLDYARKEVREHHLALVKEYFDRFEMDGFELDWMRSPFYFKPGFAEQNCGILTEFMREVKKLAKQAERRWGHPIKISIRVPSRPEEALYAGLDVFTWCKEKLTDMVTPSPYYQSSESGLPVGIWRRLLPEHIELTPCLDQHLGSSFAVRMRATPEIDTGFAASYYHQGADGIYLFNHMYRDSINDWSGQREMFTYLGTPDALRNRSRRYVATFHECMVEGIPNHAAFDHTLPAGGTNSVRLNAGAVPVKSSGNVILGISGHLPEHLEVRLNTAQCTLVPVPASLPLPEKPEAFLAFQAPAGTLHDGENLIDLINKGDKNSNLDWAELYVSPIQAGRMME